MESPVQESIVVEGGDTTAAEKATEALIMATMWNVTRLRVAGSGDCAAIRSFTGLANRALTIVHAIVTEVLDVVAG